MLSFFSLLISEFVLLVKSSVQIFTLSFRLLVVLDDVPPQVPFFAWLAGNRDCLVDHLECLGNLRERVFRQVRGSGRVKLLDESHVVVAGSGLVFNFNFRNSLDHGIILLLASEKVFQLLAIHEFTCSITAHQEKSRMSNSFRWRHELALLLDVLPIDDSWRRGFLVVNALDHLVQIKRNRQLLS